MKTGDVFWADLPMGVGHAQSGRRPCVVWQNQDATQVLPTVLLIPLTTQTAALRFPSTLLIAPDAFNGLRRDSVALIFQLTATDKRFIEQKIGSVAPSVVQALEDELAALTTDKSA